MEAKKIRRALATFFYTGYSPVAPGTCASVLSAGFYLLIAYGCPGCLDAAVGILVAATFAANIRVGSWAQKEFGEKDPQKVVIDEALGFFAAVFLISGPQPWLIAVIALALFRVFDIAKPFPIRYLEKLRGGWGIALDDFGAGIAANLVFRIGLLVYVALDASQRSFL